MQACLPRSRHMPTFPALAALISPLLLPPAMGAAAPVAPVIRAPAACLATRMPQELPLVYIGDGLTVTVLALDANTGDLEGTIALEGKDALPFKLQLNVDSAGLEVGKGEVREGTKTRRIRSKEVGDDSVRITYRAKRYVVTLRSGEEEVEDNAQPEAAIGPAERSRPKLSTVRLRQHTFKDKGMSGMESHTILVPDGWKAEGGAFWAPRQWVNVMPSQDIRVTGPDGTLVSIEPSFMAKDFTPPPGLGMQKPPTGSVDGGFPVVPWPTGIAQWKRWLGQDVIKAAFPKATGIQVKDAMMMPELTESMRRAYAPLKRMLESKNGLGGVRTTADCQVLGFYSTYTIDGTPLEELRLVSLTSTVNEGSYIGSTVMWSIDRAFTYRAPEGTLEENMGLLKAIADSVRMTDKWFSMRADLQARLLKISRQIALDNMNAARKRSEILAQSSQDLNRISSDGYRNRQAIRDGVHKRVIHSIRVTEVYSVPGANQSVHLPSSYDNVYTNGQGEFLLTNDTLFQPGVDLEYDGSSWTKMSVARK